MMRILLPKHLLLPLTMLAFVGVAITFLSPLFTLSTRWLVLGLLLVYSIVNGSWLRIFTSGFGIFTVIYALWALLTSVWSEVPQLSLMKAGAFMLVIITCLAAGYHWVRHHPNAAALDYLVPLTVAALAAGIFGRYAARPVDISGDTVMYQGLVYGSNMFGSMLAMCSPYLIWKTWSHWSRPRLRWVWLLVLLISLYYLFAASSRGAILIVLCTATGLFLCLSLSRRLLIMIATFVVFVLAFLFTPGRLERLQQQYIYKQASAEQGILYTRAEVWQVSYAQAQKGGWVGGGFGVTIGGSKSFRGGLTSIGYGREKGNSQLAIVEETGIIGFLLYLVSLALLFTKLVGRLLVLPRSPQKSLLAIVTGCLCGMLVGSVFEAWWVAPGSPESMFFWVLTGIGLGLASARRETSAVGAPQAAAHVMPDLLPVHSRTGTG